LGIDIDVEVKINVLWKEGRAERYPEGRTDTQKGGERPRRSCKIKRYTRQWMIKMGDDEEMCHLVRDIGQLKTSSSL